MRKSTREEVISKANHIHNYKYDYSLITLYKGCMIKYPIICPLHGEFYSTMDNHISKKSGCPKCSNKNLSYKDKLNKLSLDFEYLVNNDFKSNEKIKIKCLKCDHIFERTYDNHLKGQKCPNCSNRGRKSLTLDEIKDKLSKDKEYDLSEYKDTNSKIGIKCPKHGWYYQKLANHLQGYGCPKCNKSKGEEEIRKYLEHHKIPYLSQYKFKDCINPKTNYQLIFDFYVDGKCIEYDGELHYKAVDYFGGQELLEEYQFKDKIKSDYCIRNNIPLLRISYLDYKNINLLLNSFLNLK